MKTKHLLLPFALFVYISGARAQMRVLSGTNVKVLPGTELSTKSGLLLENNATIAVVPTGSLNISGGDMMANGKLQMEGELKFTGSSLQIVEGELPFYASGIEINNAKGVSFRTETTVLDSLKLVNGKMYVNSKTPLHFAPTALNPVETSQSHIEGRAIMDERVIGTAEVPLFLGTAITGGADIGVVSIDRVTGPEGIIIEATDTANVSTSVASKWTIYTSINAEIDNRNVTFQWLPEFDNNKDVNALDLYRAPIDGEVFQKLSGGNISYQATGMRSFIRNRVPGFNSVFALADRKSNLEEPPIGQAIKNIFPNPFTDRIIIQLDNTNGYPVVVRFINTFGSVAYQITLPTANNTVTIENLAFLPQGSYWLHIYTHGSVVSAQVKKF